MIIFVLTEYTNETFFHKFINNFLRSTEKSSQIYYLHYFVRCLHLSIFMHYKLDNKMIKKEFMCYRGGWMQQSEIKMFENNISKNVETLGFLSTSLRDDIALTFIVNVLIVIEVKDQKRLLECDFGYAFLNQLSQHQNEQEILFNALTKFMVKRVTKTITINNLQYTLIQLVYEDAAATLNKYNQDKNLKLSKQQQKTIMLSQYQQVYYNQGSRNYEQIQLSIVHLEKCIDLYSKSEMSSQRKKQLLRLKYCLHDCYLKAGFHSKNAIRIKKQLLKPQQIHDEESLYRQQFSIRASLTQLKYTQKIDKCHLNDLLKRNRLYKIAYQKLKSTNNIPQGQNQNQLIRILADEIQICLRIEDFPKDEIASKIDDFKYLARKHEGEYGFFYAIACNYEKWAAEKLIYPMKKFLQIKNQKIDFFSNTQSKKIILRLNKQVQNKIKERMLENKFEQAIDIALSQWQSEELRQQPRLKVKSDLERSSASLIIKLAAHFKTTSQVNQILALLVSKIKYNKQQFQYYYSYIRSKQQKTVYKLVIVLDKYILKPSFQKKDLHIPIAGMKLFENYQKKLCKRSYFWITFRLLIASLFEMVGQYEQAEYQIEQLIDQVREQSSQFQQMFNIFDGSVTKDLK